MRLYFKFYAAVTLSYSKYIIVVRPTLQTGFKISTNSLDWIFNSFILYTHTTRVMSRNNLHKICTF